MLHLVLMRAGLVPTRMFLHTIGVRAVVFLTAWL